MILRSFSWLAVHELVQAAEASVLPVREGVAKPQPRSTGSSISNSIPNANGGLYSARFRCRPGRPRSSVEISPLLSHWKTNYCLSLARGYISCSYKLFSAIFMTRVMLRPKNKQIQTGHDSYKLYNEYPVQRRVTVMM